jgi:Zn ribbon nucleic-acid-binding protein
MQSAEIIGLNEIELRGFLNSLPELWNARKRFFQSGISPILSNYVVTDKILASTHIFSSSNSLFVLFTEFLKEIGAATFKIHAYMSGLGFPSLNEWAEIRFREIIVEFSERDMSSFREAAFLAVFTCPICGALYSFRSLKKTEDGLFECQNCGKLVRVKEPEAETALQTSDKSMGLSE